MSTCPICIEKITKSQKVECHFCNYVTCNKCVETYLVSSADDANCMNCKRQWDRETLLKYLSKNFVNNVYKKHRENMLLERETAMMPATQAYVEREIQRRKNNEVLQKLHMERTKLKKQMRELDRTIWTVSANLTPPLENERRSFIHKCSVPDCRGMLSMAWKCNICSTYTCSECNAVKGPDRDSPHVCKEEDKLTMQMLKTDSKKCPGCAQYIFKIDGCDQMWCVGCHTAFSWRTGQIINGTIHNPHFYEFQRNNGVINRQMGDIPCGGLPSYRSIASALQQIRMTQRYDDVLKFHRLTAHIELDEIPRYTHNLTEETNIDLRVRYMISVNNVCNFNGGFFQIHHTLKNYT
jgi:hypothetical protein